MEITTTFRHMESSPPLRDYAEKRIRSLQRFSEGLQRANIVLSVEKLDHLCDVRLVADGTMITAKEASHDMYASIDLLFEKMKRRLKRHKERASERKIEVSDLDSEDSLNEEALVSENGLERNELHVKPIFPDDAILEISSTERNFFVFLNAENQRINVVYKKNDGQYSLIDPII